VKIGKQGHSKRGIRGPHAGSESLMMDVRQAMLPVDASLSLSNVCKPNHFYLGYIPSRRIAAVNPLKSLRAE
jgi:hypothetical protein